jgi:Roadblock/LC7 domain
MPAILALMQELAAYPGVRGCALVDADSGMVWHHAGNLPDTEQLAEASIEFWRVHQRLSDQLCTLGELQSAMYSFADCVVALFPCITEPHLVLICVADKGKLAWRDWSAAAHKLRKLLSSKPPIVKHGGNSQTPALD